MLDEIVLMRHGQSKANTRELVPMQYGDHMIPLTEDGERQAFEVGQALGSDFFCSPDNRTLVYSSPYRRTRQTLEHVIRGSGVKVGHRFSSTNVYEDPRLREVDHGYGTVDDYQNQQAKRERHGWFYYRFNGGESPADCFDRVSGFVDSMFRQVDRKRSRKVLIVSHGLTIRCFVMRFLHLSPEDFDRMANPENAAMIRIKRIDRNTTYILPLPPTDRGAFTTGSWTVHGLKLRES